MMFLEIVKINLFIFLLLLSFVSNEYIFKSELKNRPTSFVSISTTLGYLIGYEQNVSSVSNYKSVANKTINVFYGIPFTEPPERFKKAKLIEKFSNQPYEALHFKDHCPVVSDNYHHEDKFSEDCLYLNIWTPNLKKLKLANGTCTKRFNVLVYIYDSTSSIYQMYQSGDSSGETRLFYSGELFAALHDTIFITFNHRQGLFGSFYLGKDNAPGNLLFFDQNVAMQFVQKYIRDFCGEDKFSLIGHGYGGSSIAIHLLSDYVKDLNIKTAILQSSIPFFDFRKPVSPNEALINSLLSAYSLGCLDFKSDKINDNINYLDDRVSTEFFKITNGRYSLNENLVIRKLKENSFNFNPQITDVFYLNNDDYIERDVIKLSKFLSKYSVNLDCLQNATVEKILSINENHHNENWNLHWPDGDFISEDTYFNYRSYDKLDLKSNASLLIGQLLDENGHIGIEFKDKFYTDRLNAPVIELQDAKEILKKRAPLFKENLDILDKLANYYTNESNFLLSKGYYQAINDLDNDINHHCPAYFSANHLAQKTDVYSYIISYKFQKHYLKKAMNFNGVYDWIDQIFSDELSYLFGLPFRTTGQFTHLDRKFSLELMQLWTSFSKNGKMPDLTNGRKWPASNQHNNTTYVEINGQFRRVRKFQFEERCADFWREYLVFYKR